MSENRVIGRGDEIPWRVRDDQKAAFEAAGFGPEQVLEVIAGIALKAVTNYVSSGLDLPLDGQFQPYAWAAIGEETECRDARGE